MIKDSIDNYTRYSYTAMPGGINTLVQVSAYFEGQPGHNQSQGLWLRQSATLPAWATDPGSVVQEHDQYINGRFIQVTLCNLGREYWALLQWSTHPGEMPIAPVLLLPGNTGLIE